MPTNASKATVQVRGTCAAGHTTQTRSNAGRVTWEGECAVDGCANKVKARRVPKDRTSPPVADAATPAPTDPHQLRRVDYAAPQPRHIPDEPPAGGSGAAGGAGHDSGGEPAVPGTPVPVPIPVQRGTQAGGPPARARFRERLAQRRRSREGTHIAYRGID